MKALLSILKPSRIDISAGIPNYFKPFYDVSVLQSSDKTHIIYETKGLYSNDYVTVGILWIE